MILAKIDLDYFHTCWLNLNGNTYWLTNKGFYNYTGGSFLAKKPDTRQNAASKVTSAKSKAEEIHRHNTP